MENIKIDYNTQRLYLAELEKYQIEFFSTVKKLQRFCSVGKPKDHLPKFK